MAKDGTNRGGRRVRSGERPQPLAEKIAQGKSANIINLPIAPVAHSGAASVPLFGATAQTSLFANLEGETLCGTADLYGEDMPNPSEYLSARQRNGKPLGADEIFVQTWKWLKERKCERLVNPRLLEGYSQAFARYIQCEEAISEYGLLGKHPTTGAAISSPFVQMSQSFQKQANLLWYEIFDIVKQNCTSAYVGNPMEDNMERLLRSKEGK